MRKQLISFETAELAKEKRFDYPTYWYCSYKRKFPTNPESFFPSISQKPVNWNDDKDLNFYERFSLPTQSLLQKWLREKHGIHIVLVPQGYNNDVRYIIYIVKLVGGNVSVFDKLSKRSEKLYEDALEEALIKSLNLID